MFFKECDNYVDGGVLANNPCEYGMTRIQNHYRQMEKKLDISLVVSVGTGKYPATKVEGTVDAQELFVLANWFTNRPDTMMKKAQNLISLLSNAVSFFSLMSLGNSDTLWSEASLRLSLIQRLCIRLGDLL